MHIIVDYSSNSEYNQLCATCDVGMILLDNRFTIPNYHSRTISYMENASPFFACTDKISDIKELVESLPVVESGAIAMLWILIPFAMQCVDYVFHAAALKQVSSCEFFPIEAVKTNVLGTENVLNVAIDAEGVSTKI